MARPYRERKLIRALRGTDGYAVQQEAWNAVMPDWRRCLQLVNRDPSACGQPLTPQELADLSAFSECLRANNRFLASPWYQLLMQDLYRSCPALGGWFPE